MIPSQVKIGAIQWQVEIVDDLKDRQKLGECNHSKNRILIASEASEGEQESTLIHELLHACCYFAGMEEGKFTEEDFVTRLAPILHTVLRENGFWVGKRK